MTQAQTAPLIVSVDTKGYAAVVIAKWGVQNNIFPRVFNSFQGFHGFVTIMVPTITIHRVRYPTWHLPDVAKKNKLSKDDDLKVHV